MQGGEEGGGPCHRRNLRPEADSIYDDQIPFPLGGHRVLAEGHDILPVASGSMVHEALKAIEKLGEEGIDASPVDLDSIPFDPEPILKLARGCGGKVLAIEDTGTGGGGSEAGEILLEHGGMFPRSLLTGRKIPQSGRKPAVSRR